MKVNEELVLEKRQLFLDADEALGIARNEDRGWAYCHPFMDARNKAWDEYRATLPRSVTMEYVHLLTEHWACELTTSNTCLHRFIKRLEDKGHNVGLLKGPYITRTGWHRAMLIVDGKRRYYRSWGGWSRPQYDDADKAAARARRYSRLERRHNEVTLVGLAVMNSLNQVIYLGTRRCLDDRVYLSLGTVIPLTELQVWHDLPRGMLPGYDKAMVVALDRCTCNIGWAAHECPYQEDMYGNDDPYFCACCPYCRKECERSL